VRPALRTSGEIRHGDTVEDMPIFWSATLKTDCTTEGTLVPGMSGTSLNSSVNVYDSCPNECPTVERLPANHLPDARKHTRPKRLWTRVFELVRYEFVSPTSAHVEPLRVGDGIESNYTGVAVLAALQSTAMDKGGRRSIRGLGPRLALLTGERGHELAAGGT
jgi:hypothetical protein